jgi:hypothetical protein
MACEVSSLVPTITPSQTPDRIATRVAEDKAVAATLTADASKMKQIALPTETREVISARAPSLTPTPILAAQTPILSPVAPGRVEGRIPRASGVKMTLCALVTDFTSKKQYCSQYQFQESVTIDSMGYFLFAAVPPGSHGVIFDIPESLEKVIPEGSLCFCSRDWQAKIYGRFPISKGAQDACVYPVLEVKPGETVQYTTDCK